MTLAATSIAASGLAEARAAFFTSVRFVACRLRFQEWYKSAALRLVNDTCLCYPPMILVQGKNIFDRKILGSRVIAQSAR
jgi:hypothetical protein